MRDPDTLTPAQIANLEKMFGICAAERCIGAGNRAMRGTAYRWHDVTLSMIEREGIPSRLASAFCDLMADAPAQQPARLYGTIRQG